MALSLIMFTKCIHWYLKVNWHFDVLDKELYNILFHGSNNVLLILLTQFCKVFYFSLLTNWIITGCLSPYYLPSNFGKHGTACSPFECICIAETGQPFWYAIKEVCPIVSMNLIFFHDFKIWFRISHPGVTEINILIWYSTGITN